MEAESDAGIYPLVPRPLSTRSRYKDVPEIERLEAVGSPIHVATHEIAGATPQTRRYCATHSHPFAEVNVLLGGPGDLKYRIRIGKDEQVVESPCSVWIPAGVPHSANLEAGHGTFLVVYVLQPQTDPLVEP